MSALSVAVRDSTTMTRRSLRRIVRYPSMTVILIGMPVVFLLLFVYVFGETLGAGLGSVGREGYANYVTPGVLLITVAAAAQGTAISVAMDMNAGLIARFRTMPVTRSAVLTGHAVSAFVQTLLSVVVVLGQLVDSGATQHVGADPPHVRDSVPEVGQPGGRVRSRPAARDLDDRTGVAGERSRAGGQRHDVGHQVADDDVAGHAWSGGGASATAICAASVALL